MKNRNGVTYCCCKAVGDLWERDTADPGMLLIAGSMFCEYIRESGI